MAQSNIRTAMGEHHEEARAIARANFVHLAQVFLETAQTGKINASNYERFMEVEGLEHLIRSKKMGKGVLLLTGHFGNWEWMAYCSPFLQLGRLNIVARPLRPPRLHRLVRSLRENSGNRVIDKKDATRPILKALARNETVGILLDQNAGRETGAYAPFFGGYVPTHRAMALLAIKSGAPVHPVFNWREPSGKYHVEVHPAIDIPRTGTLSERIYQATALFNESLERQIRRCPTQWYWVHRRFRYYTRQPPQK